MIWTHCSFNLSIWVVMNSSQECSGIFQIHYKVVIRSSYTHLKSLPFQTTCRDILVLSTVVSSKQSKMIYKCIVKTAIIPIKSPYFVVLQYKDTNSGYFYIWILVWNLGSWVYISLLGTCAVFSFPVSRFFGTWNVDMSMFEFQIPSFLEKVKFGLLGVPWTDFENVIAAELTDGSHPNTCSQCWLALVKRTWVTGCCRLRGLLHRGDHLKAPEDVLAELPGFQWKEALYLSSVKAGAPDRHESAGSGGQYSSPLD